MSYSIDYSLFDVPERNRGKPCYRIRFLKKFALNTEWLARSSFFGCHI